MLLPLRIVGETRVLGEPDSVPWDGGLAEPQRRALSGQSGVLVGVDYRGETVLAAYEPVGGHGWGMVAKMDLAEVRTPFLRVSGALLLVAVGLIALGLVRFRRLGEPFIRQLSLSEERYRLIPENTLDGIWILDSDFRFTYVNPAVEPLLGYIGQERV